MSFQLFALLAAFITSTVRQSYSTAMYCLPYMEYSTVELYFNHLCRIYVHWTVVMMVCEERKDWNTTPKLDENRIIILQHFALRTLDHLTLRGLPSLKITPLGDTGQVQKAITLGQSQYLAPGTELWCKNALIFIRKFIILEVLIFSWIVSRLFRFVGIEPLALTLVFSHNPC